MSTPPGGHLMPTAAGWAVVSVVDGSILAVDEALSQARKRAWWRLFVRVDESEARAPSGMTRHQMAATATYRLAGGYENKQVTPGLMDDVRCLGGGIRTVPNEHGVLRRAVAGDPMPWDAPRRRPRAEDRARAVRNTLVALDGGAAGA